MNTMKLKAQEAAVVQIVTLGEDTSNSCKAVISCFFSNRSSGTVHAGPPKVAIGRTPTRSLFLPSGGTAQCEVRSGRLVELRGPLYV